MKIRSSEDVLRDQLNDLHSCETQAGKSWPALAGAAMEAATRHLETLAFVSELVGHHPSGDPCKAMQGLIEGGDEHLSRAEPPATRDLLLIAHCNRILHYEVAAFGFTSALARSLGYQEAAEALSVVFSEKLAQSKELAHVAAAEFGINPGGAL
jgi:ferritin-like metal-binding protein YciE